MAELKIAVRIDSIPVDLRRRGGLQRALQTAAQLGVSAVELCARTAVRPSEMSDTGLRQLRKMLSDLDLRVASLRFQTRRGYDNPQDLDRRVDATKQAMRLAYRLGAPVVVNQIGRVPEPRGTTAGEQAAETQSGSGDRSGAAEDPAWQSLRTVLDDLGRFGTRVGALLAAETGTEPGQRLAALLDTSDEAFIAVALNPGQLIINRHDVREAVVALRDRIQLVSAVDGVLDLAAGRGLSVPLGQGTADFPELIGLLEDIQYRGDYVIGRHEMAPERALEELQQSVSYLRSL